MFNIYLVNERIESERERSSHQFPNGHANENGRGLFDAYQIELYIFNVFSFFFSLLLKFSAVILIRCHE